MMKCPQTNQSNKQLLGLNYMMTMRIFHYSCLFVHPKQRVEERTWFDHSFMCISSSPAASFAANDKLYICIDDGICSLLRFCKHSSYCKSVKTDPIHLGVACCIRCVMQHCFSLVSCMLKWQLTAVLGESFVLLPYLCAHCSSGTSHPTCSPHPPSLYIKLNLTSSSGDAEVGYICLPTQRGDAEVSEDFRHLGFM